MWHTGEEKVMMFRCRARLACDALVCTLMVMTAACTGSGVVAPNFPSPSTSSPSPSPTMTHASQSRVPVPSETSANSTSSADSNATAAPNSRSPSAASCPITRPPDPPMTPPPSIMETRIAPNMFWYGNEALWVVLPADSVTWSRKVMWWRTIPGQMTIEGVRLDAPAPPLESSVPRGYGDIGFQASGIIFPTTGCWEVVGKIAGKELRFVVTVVPPPPIASPHP